MSTMKAFVSIFSIFALSRTVFGAPVYTIDSKVDDGTFVGFGCAIDSSGIVYYSDATHHVINQVNMADAVSPILIAGTYGTYGNTGDGGLAVDALIHSPHQMFVNRHDELLFTDYDNYVVRKIDLSTGDVVLIAGSYVQTARGWGDGGQATSAQLQGPQGVWEDNHDNFYVSDKSADVIYKVNGTTGIITFLAQDGISTPQGIYGDPSGSFLYVTSEMHHMVKKLDLLTAFNTMYESYGTSYVSGATGDGGNATLAKFKNPRGVFVDNQNNVFINDFGNRVVRRIDAITGIIERISGTYGVQSHTGDGEAALDATHIGMNQIVGNNADSLFIAEQNTVRVLYSATAEPTFEPTSAPVSMCRPNVTETTVVTTTVTTVTTTFL